MRMLCLLVTFFVLAIENAPAKVAPIPFAKLVEGSDIIVVATVTSVSQTQTEEAAYAIGRVIEVWKGQPGDHVEFLASPTWTCDISGAQQGETVLLFLTKGQESRSYMIGHSGRGRMPLSTMHGKRYATFWEDLILPQGTATIAGPEKEFTFIRSVEVAVLMRLVRDSTRSTPKA